MRDIAISAVRQEALLRDHKAYTPASPATAAA